MSIPISNNKRIALLIEDERKKQDKKKKIVASEGWVGPYVKKIRDTYGHDPVKFFKDFMPSRVLYEWQKEELIYLTDKKGFHRLAVAGCNASGKTEFNAMAAVWKFLTSPNSIVNVMALTGYQAKRTLVNKILWYLRKFSEAGLKVFWDTDSFEKIVTVLPETHRNVNNWYIALTRVPIDSGDSSDLGKSSGTANRSAALLGVHNESGEMMYIFDECACFPDYAFGHARRCLQANRKQLSEGVDNYFIATSNPSNIHGEFYKMFFSSTYASWRTRNISFKDIPYYDKQFAAETELIHGADSYEYQVYCLGQFPSMATPHAVFDRKKLIEAGTRSDYIEGDFIKGRAVIGVDISPTARAKTCVCVRYDNVILYLDCLDQDEGNLRSSYTELVYKISSLYDKYMPGKIVVDNGCSGNVFISDYLAPVMRAKTSTVKIYPLIAAGPADDKYTYGNIRAELVAKFSDWINLEGSIPGKHISALESVANQMEYLSTTDITKNPRMKVTAKQDIKKVSGNGKDLFDACIYTFYRDDFDFYFSGFGQGLGSTNYISFNDVQDTDIM